MTAASTTPLLPDVGSRARQTLDYLAVHPDGVDYVQMADDWGVPTTRAAGWLSTVRRAHSWAVEIREEVKTVGGRRRYVYRPSRQLRAVYALAPAVERRQRTPAPRASTSSQAAASTPAALRVRCALEASEVPLSAARLVYETGLSLEAVEGALGSLPVRVVSGGRYVLDQQQQQQQQHEEQW